MSVKISFVGDIMCEEPFLRAAKKKDGQYDFSKAFKGMKEICKLSDYVIGNLETPLAGKEKRYTHEMYSFNTPDVFVQAIKEMGISFVVTANNHCCDRGIDGLKRTLSVLDQYKVPHVGTYQNETEDRVAYINVEDVRIAIVSCTSSTNPIRNKYKPDVCYVNLLQDQSMTCNTLKGKYFLGEIRRFIHRRIIGEKNFIRIKKMCGLPPKKASVDDLLDNQKVDSYVEAVCRQIRNAKEHADLVFVCPHMGGQFNVEPGKFSEYVMSCMVESGADAVVASHPHIVQKAEVTKGVPCFFSLGNVSMSMSTLYILHDNLPDYGIMPHFYIDDKKIKKVTYSVIKIIEDRLGYLQVRPAYDLYKNAKKEERERLINDTQKIVQCVTRNKTSIVKCIPKEFILFEMGRENND